MLEFVARFTVHDVLGEPVVDMREPEERRMSAELVPPNVSQNKQDGRSDLKRVHTAHAQWRHTMLQESRSRIQLEIAQENVK